MVEDLFDREIRFVVGENMFEVREDIFCQGCYVWRAR